VRWGVVIFWGVVGAGALLSSFWVDWFVVHLAGYGFNLGWPAAIYALILGTRNLFLKPHLGLTPREMHDWAGVLEEETGRIVELYGAGMSTADIAAKLKADSGVPLEVTLKYIIAVAKYQKENAAKAEEAE